MSYYAIYTILYVMYLHIQLIPGGNQTPRDIDACRQTTMEDAHVYYKDLRKARKKP